MYADGNLSDLARISLLESDELDIKLLTEKFDLWCQDWAESSTALKNAKDRQASLDPLQRSISKLAKQLQHMQKMVWGKNLAAHAVEAHQMLHDALAKEAHKQVWQAEMQDEVSQVEARRTSDALSRQMRDFYANSSTEESQLVWKCGAGSSSDLAKGPAV